jgi:hypothetical protein
MSLYVYAIVDRGCHPSAEWRGLIGAELSTVTFRSLAAVVSEIAAPPQRETAALMRHEALVEALAEHHRTLPVRFGTVFSDAGAVTTALSERYESLAADLVRLGDKVELGLLAAWRAPRTDASEIPTASRASSAGEGARYLEARRCEYSRVDAGKAAARELACDLDRAVRDHALDRRITVMNEGPLVLRAAYLVAPAEVAVIRDLVDEMRARRRDVAIVLSGPWPPYSFVAARPGMGVEATPTVPHAR